MDVGTRFALAAVRDRSTDAVASVVRKADAWSARAGAGWNETCLIGTGPRGRSGPQRVDESGELV
jgi:hypothetical protein